MRILIACEYSGRVRDAFTARGHDAMSCDLLPSESPGRHYQGDVRDVMYDGWDMLIAHPPCTYLTNAGARWWKDRQAEQAEALDFVRMLLAAPIKRKCIENPPGKIGSAIRKASQYVHPWQFGHPETKTTGLWLDELPLLVPTHDMRAEMALLTPAERHRIHWMKPGPDRWKDRSRTYPGIAAAMADQWGLVGEHESQSARNLSDLTAQTLGGMRYAPESGFCNASVTRNGVGE